MENKKNQDLSQLDICLDLRYNLNIITIENFDKIKNYSFFE